MKIHEKLVVVFKDIIIFIFVLVNSPPSCQNDKFIIKKDLQDNTVNVTIYLFRTFNWKKGSLLKGKMSNVLIFVDVHFQHRWISWFSWHDQFKDQTLRDGMYQNLLVVRGKNHRCYPKWMEFINILKLKQFIFKAITILIIPIKANRVTVKWGDSGKISNSTIYDDCKSIGSK